MTVKECIDYVDAIKPNAFTNEEKTEWLNEVEGKVQLEVYLWAINQVMKYDYYEPFSAAATYAVGDKAEKGGTVYSCTTAITTPAAWDATKWEATTLRDDKNKEMLVRPPHDKLYRSYLTAKIDFANGEYDKYANTAMMFNSDFGEFMRWFALTYRPADTHREVYHI